MNGPLSEHPNAAVRGLATGQWTTDDFREHLRTVGTPLIDAAPADARLEPVGEPSDAQHVAVTFVRDLEADGLDGNTDAEAPVTHLRTLIDRALPPREPFRQVPGTPFQVLTLVLPADLRFTYLLGESLPDGTRRQVPDPYNSRKGDPKIGGSVAVLPQAEVPAQQRDGATAVEPAGARLSELAFTSDILDNTRSIWVSVPPGWNSGGGPYPFVVMFDGHAEHSAPAVRDRLVTAGLVRPCVIILVDEAGLRDVELTGNPDFTDALTRELLPWLRPQFALSDDPRDAAAAGKSFGGLCAGLSALQAPDVFGNAVMHSPSAWYHPSLTLGPGAARQPDADRKAAAGRVQGRGPAGTDNRSAETKKAQAAAGSQEPRPSAPVEEVDPVPLLIEKFSQSASAPIRLYHECGTLEYGPPPAQIWQKDANKWLHRVLDAKGYDTVYYEFRGGHDAAWWDETWARALQWLFPIDAGRGE